jgi:hypothetical protein
VGMDAGSARLQPQTAVPAVPGTKKSVGELETMRRPAANSSVPQRSHLHPPKNH